MSVDLHRIGTTISRGSSNNGFGTIVSFPSVPPSFPEYGELIETLSAQTRPISEGGSYLTINAANYPNQLADVNRLADGVGGSFLDWANAYNIHYFGVDTTITTASGSHSVTINGSNYSVGSYTTTYFHDGMGSYYGSTDNSYSSYGTYLTGQTGVTSYINIDGTDYINGSYDVNYYSDGSGSYYSNNENYSYTSYGTFIVSFNNATEVPAGSGLFYSNGTSTDWYHNGSGGSYNALGGSYIGYGNFITNDGSYDYYWDGNGGYYY